MNNSEKFLEKYKELEKIAYSKFSHEIAQEHGAVAQLEKMNIFSSIKDDLEYIRKLRIFFQHNLKIDNKFPVEVTDELIELLDSIILKVKNPPKVIDKCIRYNKIFFATKNELIFSYMLKMKENMYTYVPILEDKKVIGVFSENTLLGALTEDEIIYEKNKTRFSDNLIFKYCSLDNNISERFEFVSKYVYLEDIKELFKKSYNSNKRLSLIFITANGKREEKILGLITPWDVLGKE